MLKSSVEQVLKKIQLGVIEPVYYLTGKEKFFHDQIINQIINKILPDKSSRDLNLSILYGTENSQSELLSSVSSLPLLAQTQVIIVRDFDKMKITDAEILEKHLKNIPNATYLVLSAEEKGKLKAYKAIEQIAHNVECKPIPEYKVGEWMQNFCKQNAIPIDTNALNFLINLVGSNLLTLHNEIRKVIDFKNDQSMITMEDIEETTGISKETSVFGLQKALGNRQLEISLKIIQQLLDSGQNINLIIAILFSYFRRILIALSLKQQGENNQQISGLLHLSDFQFREISAVQNNFSTQQLYKIISYLHDLDVATKTSSISDSAGLQMLCYKICRSK